MRISINVAKLLRLKSGNRLGKECGEKGGTWPWGRLVLTKHGLLQVRCAIQPCGRESLAKCLWLTGCYCQHTDAPLFPGGPWLRRRAPKCSRAENHRTLLRTGPREERRVKDLVVPSDSELGVSSWQGHCEGSCV